MVRVGLLFILVLSLPFSVWAQEMPPSHTLDMSRLNHLYQGWNNCGPATLTMGLGYFGFPDDDMNAQIPVADYLKPTPDDQNVSFWQMADYVNGPIHADYGVRGVVRRGGDFDTLKRLLLADFPVILGKGLEIPDEGWVGHFALVIGYDDEQNAFLTYDSYKGHGNYQGLPQSYEELAPLWQQFNNVFLVLYPAERETEVATILGDLWDEAAGWTRAKHTAEKLLADDPKDLWANFNLGEALTALGDYTGAVEAYEVALFGNGQLPWRKLWYMQGAFRAYYEVGNFRRVQQLAQEVKRNTTFIEDVDYYLGLVEAAQGNTPAALEKLEAVLDFNPNFYPAAEVKSQLEAGTFIAPPQAGR